MRAPVFWWYSKPSLIAWLLSPIGAIYGAITAMRMASGIKILLIPRLWRHLLPQGEKEEATAGRNYSLLPLWEKVSEGWMRGEKQSSQKIICIGNFTAGGAGKTPIAIAIAKALQAQNISVCFLSRGYGGTVKFPVLVVPQFHTASQVGDEPLLLTRIAPTIVSRNRAAGLALCAATKADIIIMDDGLQSPALKKDFSIAVVDSEVGIGNGLCIPAGPLRAPLAQQLPYVQAIVFLGHGTGADGLKIQAREHGMCVLDAELQSPSHVISSLRDKLILAYSGIGRPQKFFDYLTALGGAIGATQSFPDHYSFTQADATALLDQAQREHMTLFTTEKDHVRLPKNDTPLGILAARSRVIPVEAEIKNVDSLILKLQALIA
jgi:tetraacyldisaccharide 4'-kinase